MMRLAGLALVIILAGCAASAAGPAASIDLNALVRAHPLYGTLAQYDRQIAALRAALHEQAFSHRSEALDNAIRGSGSTLDEAAARARQIAAMPTPDVRALQRSANLNAPSEAQVRSDMQQTYARQSSQLQSAAESDMVRYRASLLSAQQAALAGYERAVHARVQQAYASRRQELYEKESTLALDLAKADAPQRLSIRTKLQTLRLRPEQRHALVAQMASIQRREDAVVEKAHAHDQAVLAAFLPPLQARADADIARVSADLHNRTAANLAARERVLAAQRAQSMPLQFGKAANAPPPSANMQGQLEALLGARPADPRAFTAARDDLARHFSAIRQTDDTASADTYAQISQIEDARTQLYKETVTQIMREADAVARSRGLGTVYVRGQAPPGSADITREVATKLAQLIL